MTTGHDLRDRATPPGAGGTALIALDWGSTRLRAWRLGAGGAVLQTRTSDDGASRLAGGAPAFERALHGLVHDWRAGAARAVPVLACGMVGSAHGWREAAYVDCPLALDALHRHLTPVPLADGGVVHLVPGLRTRGADGLPDVMRGEETQLLGLLAETPTLAAGSTVVLPGTHSKWVTVRDAGIEGFATHLTGELFAVLRQHSVLGRLMADAAPADSRSVGADIALARDAASDLVGDAAFDRGVDASSRSRDLTRLLFSVRTLGLGGELPARALADYLSGLLIGAELAAALPHADPAVPIVVVGEAALVARYRRALARVGRPASSDTAGAPDTPDAPESAEPAARAATAAAAAGLWRLARDAGWT